MKHTIIIWSENKENGNSRIECRINITEDDIEKLAVEKYINDYTIDENRKYTAEIDETIH